MKNSEFNFMLSNPLIMICLGFIMINAYAAEEFVLLENGKTDAVIVVYPNASQRTQEAAKDLSEYLQKISGATFNIQTSQ